MTGSEAHRPAQSSVVLLVDGDPESRARIAELLRESGFRVRQAPSAEALEVLSRTPCAVLSCAVEPSEFDDLSRLDEAETKARALQAVREARQQASALIQSVGALEAALSGQPSAPESRATLAPLPLDPLERLEPELRARLSPRECDVARLLAQGRPISDLASLLDLSPNTVRNHVKSIFGKLGVHSQVALVSLLSGQAR